MKKTLLLQLNHASLQSRHYCNNQKNSF